VNIDDALKARKQAKQPPEPRPNLTVVRTHIDHPWAIKALNEELENVRASVEGNRRTTLLRAANKVGQLIPHALNQAQVTDLLRTTAVGKGLELKEIHDTVEAGLKWGMDHPRTLPEALDSVLSEREWLAELGAQEGVQGSQNGTQASQTVEAVESTEIAQFWQTRPELGIIKQAAQARQVSPFAVLGVVFARMLTVTPHSITIPPLVGGIGSLNLFIGLVGPSGAGKGSAVACATELFNIQDPLDGTTGRKFVNLGSGEGIVHTYRKKPTDAEPDGIVNTAALFNVAEIDFLTATANRQGATIMPMLRSMWSGEQLGFQNADPTRRIQVPAHSYRATLVCGIQPMKAAALLNDSDGGTPQRFTFMPTDDPTAPDVPPPFPPTLTWTHPQSTGPEHTNNLNSIGGRNMVLPDHVTQTIHEQRLRMLKDQHNASQHISGHDMLNRIKLACCFALLNNNHTVTDTDWDLAGTLHRISLHQRTQIQNQLQARARDEADNKAKRQARTAGIIDATLEGQKRHKAALRIITQLETRGPMSSSDLRSGCTSNVREHFDDAIQMLVDNSKIEPFEIGNGKHYRIKK